MGVEKLGLQDFVEKGYFTGEVKLQKKIVPVF